MPPRRVFALALTALAVTAGPAHASFLRFDFSGVIEAAGSDSGVEVGQRFNGSFSYNPTYTSPWVGFDGSRNFEMGHFGPDAPDAGFSLTVVGQTLFDYHGQLDVNLQDTPFDNSWYLGAIASSRLAIRGPYEVDGWAPTLNFANPFASVFHGSFDLPTSINLADFPEAQLLVMALDAGSPAHAFSGRLDGVSVQSVPEPAWTGAVCLSVAFWLNRRRRGV